MKISKCLKFLLSKHIIIVPFDGNLTESKKVQLSTKIQEHINTKFKQNVSVNDVLTAAFNKAYGSVEKNLIVNDFDDRISLAGEGWSSSNYPANQISILNKS